MQEQTAARAVKYIEPEVTVPPRPLKELVDNLIGLPYGTGEAYDCFSLYFYLFRAATGINFNPTLTKLSDLYDYATPVPLRVEELRPLDMLFVDKQGRERDHVFVVEDHRYAVTTGYHSGVERIGLAAAIAVPNTRAYRPRIRGRE